MARIVISNFSGIYDPKRKQNVSTCFYEGLIDALVSAGNHVLHIVSNDFIEDPWGGQNTTERFISQKKALTRIKDFNPDLIITFNNSALRNLHKVVDCPYVIWDADSHKFFCDRAMIEDNPHRFHFFCFTKGGVESVGDAFKAHKSKVIHMPCATAIKARKKKLNQNICFIGSYFQNSYVMKSVIGARGGKVIKDFVDQLDGDFFADIDEELEASHMGLKSQDIAVLFSPRDRLDMLNSVAKLGLTVIGPQDWANTVDFYPDIAFSYKTGLFYSVKHNQDIYNASKVGVNASHPQNIDGFPWRVMDIMASNACLVSDYKPAIEEQFGKYVKIPMYKSPAEAYDICKKLIDDEPYRQDIVQASQNAIDETCRFDHRIADMQQVLGIDLLGDSRNGKYERLASDKYISMFGRTYYTFASLAINYLLPRKSINRFAAVAMMMNLPIDRRIKELVQKRCGG